MGLTIILFFLENNEINLLPIWVLSGIMLGVGIDFDHLFHALIFNRKVALESILSFNPLKFYRDYQNGRILKGRIDFNQIVIYLSFHLIWIILVNLLISLYYPSLMYLSLLVTSVHYLMDIFALFQMNLIK